MLKKVCDRVFCELQEEASDTSKSDPLLWLMHGGPGVGKSEVIKLLRSFFEDVCGYTMGLEFQMAALQAVMAEQLGGDTLHHCCGIGGYSETGKRQTEVALGVLQWRWLIIDEVSMISAQMLAEIDCKLRDVVRKLGTHKLDDKGIARPFGGINVLFAGGFWQLDPPGGSSFP